ncbi:hypothetical protein ABWK22_01535 [Gottfriedia acidiceleris]|uniref:hypothetical protein n=1 Tax=Gottfriedia acidiceleris TaxID=371036 RepID=UPI0033998639
MNNETKTTGTFELMVHLGATKIDINDTTMMNSISNYIESRVVGSVKTYKIDLYDLYLEGKISAEDLSTFENELKTKLTIGNKVVVSKESKYVLVVQCKIKVNTIINFTKIQALVYELYSSNPKVAKLGLEKMTPEERAVMEFALTFER